jgi:hypothetical protein
LIEHLCHPTKTGEVAMQDIKERVAMLLARGRHLKEGLETTNYFTKDAYLEAIEITKELQEREAKLADALKGMIVNPPPNDMSNEYEFRDFYNALAYAKATLQSLGIQE